MSSKEQLFGMIANDILVYWMDLGYPRDDESYTRIYNYIRGTHPDFNIQPYHIRLLIERQTLFDDQDNN